MGDLAVALEEARLESASEEDSGAKKPAGREQSKAMLSKLREFEGELENADAELERIKRKMDVTAAKRTPGKARKGLLRLTRSDSVGGDRMPDGALLVATCLAREGRSKDEVRSFLRESFAGIDSSSVVKAAFSERAVAAD